MKATTSKVNVNLTPSEDQIDAVLDMQTFVDQLILIGNDNPEKSILGPDFDVWRWVIVSVEGGFQIPVPVTANKENRMVLFSHGKAHEFSKEEAAVILAINYFSHYDNIKCSKQLGQSIDPLLNFALSRATVWEDRMGGYDVCFKSYQALRSHLAANENLYSRAFAILD